MIHGIPSFLAVICAQIITFLLPTLVIARWLAGRSSWAVIGWWALFLGISSQAILGFFWGHVVRQAPETEAIIWLSGWLIATLILLLRTTPQEPHTQNSQTGFRENGILCAIITAGLLLRSIHPLRHWALGQSDAYSHLQFLQEVIDKGYIDNRLYPPGQAWIMGLPTIIFHLDPYIMARFGGAFFGLCLILAVYTLVRTTTRTHTPALFAAFLTGIFPAFNILHKTSIGVFANQLGLFLIPSLLAVYLLWRNKSFQLGPIAIAFSTGVAAMIASTPIMLIHLIILGGFERMISVHHEGRKILHSFPRIVLAFIPAALLITFHVAQSDTWSINSTFRILAPNSTPAVSSPIRASLPPTNEPATQASSLHNTKNAFYDFFEVKRFGFHNLALDSAGLTILGLFLFFFVYGCRQCLPLLALLSLWGVLTSIQTLTGWLQFSMYQREGWSLIIAIIVLASLVGGVLWDRLPHRTIMRSGIIAALLYSTGVAFLKPPGHSYFTSTAEDDIVQWIKLIAHHCQPSGLWPPYTPNDPSQQKVLNAIEPRRSPVLITRQMAGWSSGQGELALVIGRGLRKTTFNLSADKRPTLDSSQQYIFLIETGKQADAPSPQVSLFMRNVLPEMADSFAKVRDNEGLYIHAMEAFIAENSTPQWSVSRMPLSPLLNAIILTPSTRN